MGNNHPSMERASISSRRSFSSKSRSSKPSKHESFFIAHHKAQQRSQRMFKDETVETLDLKKRVIFVSLTGLYKSWRNCPSAILYSSIFMLPLKKQWIFENKYNDQHDFGQLFKDSDFIKLLKWKHSQGLIFWMKDFVETTESKKADFVEITDGKLDHITHLNINPFWKYLSNKISTMFDPATNTNYKPLILNEIWWNTEYQQREKTRFGTTSDQIIEELTFLPMRFKTISEILYQSNPSLNVVTVYSLNPNIPSIEEPELPQRNFSKTLDPEDLKLTEILTTDNTITPDPEPNDTNAVNDDVWVFAADYDEYDENADYDVNFQQNNKKIIA